MAKKKQPMKPLVSSLATSLKKYSSPTNPFTPEEVMAKKKEMLRVVEKALGKFVENLNGGKVEMNTSVDLDRLVKLSLLLTGEADTIVGKTGVEETTEEGKFDTSYIEQILDTNDPEVINMYNKLYSGMNKVNDEAE